MSIGMILLTVSAILVFFGVAERVLDKLRLTDRAALLLLALLFFGTLPPNVELGMVSFSPGGFLVPAGICVFLLVKADTAKERTRALVGSLLSGGIIYALSRLMPDEPEAIVLDPLYVYGIVGGVVAYVLGRSRRGAFVCGVLGVLWADVATAAVNWSNGVQQKLTLGGAGAFDAMMVSGILAVVLAECVGEVLERMARGTRPPEKSTVRQPGKAKEK